MNYENNVEFHLLHEEYDAEHQLSRHPHAVLRAAFPLPRRLAEENTSDAFHLAPCAARARSNSCRSNREVSIVGRRRGRNAMRKKTGGASRIREYIIRDVNDGEQEAQELAELLAGLQASTSFPCPAEGAGLRAAIRAHRNLLSRALKLIITARARREMGADIQAACGQLRNRHMSENREKQ